MRKAKARTTIRKAAKGRRAAAPKPATVPASVPGRRRRGRPPKGSRAPGPSAANSLAEVRQSLGRIASQTGLDLTAKVKDLVRLATEQGHLTHDDLNDS